MNKSLTSSLQALVAMADVELAQSALAMAEAIDGKSDADQKFSRCLSQQGELCAMFERLAAPGQSLDISAMGFLARQTHLAEGQLAVARSLKQEAQLLMDEKQLVLHRQQAKLDGLRDRLLSARMQRARWLESKAMSEREDLYLIRRHSLEVQL
jgi:hypothetical protein